MPFANFSPNASIGQMLLPFPQYSEIIDDYNDNGNATYNSLQASAQRRLSKGLQFTVAYTFEKSIDDAGNNLGGFVGTNGRTAYNNRLEKAVSANDVPHALVISYVYALPFGHGQRFAGSSSGAVNAIVSGWKFSGILSYYSGTPLGKVNSACNVPYTGTVGGSNAQNCYADFNPDFHGPVRINGSYGSGSLLGPNPPVFLDKNAFQNPAPYTFGDTPRTMAYRLRNTPTINENFMLMRDFRIRESFSAHFAVSAYNAFNRVQFSAPSQDITSAGFGLVGGQANSPRSVQLEFKLLF